MEMTPAASQHMTARMAHTTARSPGGASAQNTLQSTQAAAGVAAACGCSVHRSASAAPAGSMPLPALEQAAATTPAPAPPLCGACPSPLQQCVRSRRYVGTSQPPNRQSQESAARHCPAGPPGGKSGGIMPSVGMARLQRTKSIRRSIKGLHSSCVASRSGGQRVEQCWKGRV